MMGLGGPTLAIDQTTGILTRPATRTMLLPPGEGVNGIFDAYPKVINTPQVVETNVNMCPMNSSLQIPRPPLQEVGVGARLMHFVGQWEEISVDTYILEVVRSGYCLEFKELPPPTGVIHTSTDNAKVTRPPVFAGKIQVGLVNKIHTQDRLSGEKFKFLSISKHTSLVKLGVVWLNAKTYQTDCPVNNINFHIDCVYARFHRESVCNRERNSDSVAKECHRKSSRKRKIVGFLQYSFSDKEKIRRIAPYSKSKQSKSLPAAFNYKKPTTGRMDNCIGSDGCLFSEWKPYDQL